MAMFVLHVLLIASIYCALNEEENKPHYRWPAVAVSAIVLAGIVAIAWKQGY